MSRFLLWSVMFPVILSLAVYRYLIVTLFNFVTVILPVPIRVWEITRIITEKENT
jgi:hypothetical protein